MVPAVKQSLIFLLFGIAWILVSDMILLYTYKHDPHLYFQLQALKGLVFVVVTALFIYFITRQLAWSVSQARQEIKQANSRMAALNEEKVKYQKGMIQAIIAAQEEERRQLGNELHNNVNQILATIKLYLDLANESPAMREELIRKSSGHVNDVITELRKLSKMLSPPAQYDIGLIPSVEDLLQSTCREENIQIDFSSAGFDEAMVSPDKRIVVYRIIQEQLNNIVRYSQAKQVSVRLTNEPGTAVFLQIHDDGNSCENDHPMLNNIRNRTELIDGSLKVVADPVKGCTLQVKL